MKTELSAAVTATSKTEKALISVHSAIERQRFCDGPLSCFALADAQTEIPLVTVVRREGCNPQCIWHWGFA